MFWVFIVIEAAIAAILFWVAFVVPFDVKEEKDWKKRLQTLGGSLMFVAFLPERREYHWQFHPKMFLTGALIFASTFITWKRNKMDDDNDLGASD